MSDLLQTLTKGGQTWAHRIRTLRQVFLITFLLSLLVTCIFFSCMLLQREPSQLRLCALYFFSVGMVFGFTIFATIFALRKSLAKSQKKQTSSSSKKSPQAEGKYP